MSTTVGLPQFSHIKIEHFKSHLDALLKNHLEEIDRLLKENHHYTWDNLIYPLDSLADELERFWSPFAHMHAVMDSEAIRESYEACLPLLSAYDAAIGHNQDLYEAIKSIDQHSLNPAQKKIIADSIQDFELSGVALSKANKKRFEAIQSRLAELSSKFENNVLDATHAYTIHITEAERVAGLPEHALNTAKELAHEKGLDGFVLTLEYPCFQAVITHAEDRTLREEMYRAYITRASDQGPNAGTFDNTPLIDEILSLRHDKAELLGFNNFAELSLATKMAASTNQVTEFIYDLISRTRDKGKAEFRQLEVFAQDKWNLSPVNPWDVAYLSEKRRQDLYSLSQEELRPYFPQPKVMQGLFAIVKKLFGMSIEEIEGVDVWHKDVQCYCIVDESNQTRGYIYTDLFARPHKRNGAWMDSMQSRRKLEDGTVQLPIATLTCNFAKPSANRPAMLSHDEVVTLFHEFGHCLHHVLTQVDYLGGSGINGVEWDAVELPSQFFENWCWDEHALSLLTSHVDTGETLPSALYERLIAAKNFQSAMAMLRQMEFALFDFRIHQEYQTGKASFVANILADVRSKTSVVPIVPYNRFQHSFSHIFGGGYAAGYYSYMWAEVLSSDAFARFEEEGIFNPKTGHDFLKSILEAGGSRKAADAFIEFRGRPATIDALLRHNGIL
ncbi:TPA: M3 family metallopeptidase [Legionella pneumophila]|uniref:M3 family metallopeptidase n=1 Tax=Legionella pneumophila TaxID=446 RepID=UPI000778188F|nr:M3 family metallopeptidase [Legionella pneumophila]HCC3233104.1 M3 family metallopeptidase [Legionella pneumophila subsp. pneumophila]MCK1858802.1 M3 family metallopeptidase [Legionella pneumophila]HAT2106140.1 M3 family metallopeptidase [Legionella pneumophila]HBD7115536.1 M3 family metallopeptidase [Legionella pneumophila]HDV5713176.1 M3 family metallopeptidase [Legionella pneumophila]